mmetsp:Transcript_26049/g.64513  ORF Transcript_26049/g.64513 Transcript_26049/m.64513 type:complete len:304 (-) Transcript_26049:1219-2130(-)
MHRLPHQRNHGAVRRAGGVPRPLGAPRRAARRGRVVARRGAARAAHWRHAAMEPDDELPRRRGALAPSAAARGAGRRRAWRGVEADLGAHRARPAQTAHSARGAPVACVRRAPPEGCALGARASLPPRAAHGDARCEERHAGMAVRRGGRARGKLGAAGAGAGGRARGSAASRRGSSELSHARTSPSARDIGWRQRAAGGLDAKRCRGARAGGHPPPRQRLGRGTAGGGASRPLLHRRRLASLRPARGGGGRRHAAPSHRSGHRRVEGQGADVWPAAGLRGVPRDRGAAAPVRGVLLFPHGGG